MKFFVLVFALLATSSFADEFQNADPIDWSTVKPIVFFRKFWDDKAPELRPQESFFENYERRAKQPNGRIVGGQIAQPHQFPYQVALLTFLPSLNGTGFCGGSLVGTRTVLTAAHCVDGGSHGTSIFGAHFFANANEPNQRRIEFTSAHILMHPSWNPALVQNDVAVIQLPTVVPLIPQVIRAAILPTAEMTYDFAGEDAVASGWGVFSSDNPVVSDVLRYVYDNIITIPQCTLSTIGIAGPNNICMTGTQNRGVCNGDSGGPLTVRRSDASMHVGIASFVVASCHNTLPSVFVRTTSFLDWIGANTV
ncbi:Chymotrypsin BI [Pseudolycoriella hygida]|uniref:Chymotrypsin BI n=1 Tax=Pseudolycoriella hygida TaxID=35572 RepID=A0A9Q0S876_9DIPT|nr:Chymotrypsin BI [Pseudolycoriella hygida]